MKKFVGFAKRNLKDYLPILALIFVIVLFAILSNGQTLNTNNIKQIMLQSCTYIVAGLGIIFTMSLGNMDMSLDGIVCLSAFLGLQATEQFGPWAMFGMIIVAAIMCELVIGGINILLGINSVIVSFAVSFFGKGVAGYIIGNRSTGLSVPSVFNGLYSKTLFYAIAIVSIIVLSVVFHYTKLGKRTMAIGSNPTAAKAAGINVTKFKLLAYLVAGIMMGIATTMIVLRSGAIGATTGAGFHITMLLMMVIGGASLTGGTKEKIYSVVVGVLLFLCLENGLTVLGADPNVIGLIEGIIFLASVTLTFDRDGVPYIL
ncbi:MAG: ABC transporter permease [Hespellia sp.]|nr:ABC transporter permease [Hespellia sp.]